jgi:hypothetical protein
MLHLTIAQTNTIYVTLTEKQSLGNPNYLFRFKNRTTHEEVRFVRLYATDLSPFKERYNQFSISVNTYFFQKDLGEWEYFIYEQLSTTNTDPDLAYSLLETGIMVLDEVSSPTFTEYQSNNIFIVR